MNKGLTSYISVLFYEHHEQRLNVMIALVHLLYMPLSVDTAGFTRSSCDNFQILFNFNNL